MARLMLASITGAVGYLLLFAGIAERGRYALRPWDALSASNIPAVNGASSTSSVGGGGGGGVGGWFKNAARWLVPFQAGTP